MPQRLVLLGSTRDARGRQLRLEIAISALVLLLGLGVAAFVHAQAPASAPPTAASVNGLLQAFRCHGSETRRIIVRGVEDNYSPTGSEPNFLRADRRLLSSQSYFAGGSYDQTRPDRRFTDSVALPTNVASGLFLIKIRAVANNENDIFTLGDLSDISAADNRSLRYSSPLAQLGAHEGWMVEGDIYLVQFKGLNLRARQPDTGRAFTRTLLDYVRTGENGGWIDVAVLDDSAVDMLAVVVCLEPERGRGVSLSQFRGASAHASNIVAISCAYGPPTQHVCNPYVGDTPCELPQPVACVRQLGAPVPASLHGRLASRIWSGGELAFTEPVAAARFDRIADVDRFCARRFGTDWRTATFHDGMSYIGIAGMARGAPLEGRAWVDIADQPYATCWAR